MWDKGDGPSVIGVYIYQGNPRNHSKVTPEGVCGRKFQRFGVDGVVGLLGVRGGEIIRDVI